MNALGRVRAIAVGLVKKDRKSSNIYLDEN